MSFNRIFKGLTALLFLTTSLILSASPEINSISELENYISKSGFNGVILVKKEDKILFKRAYGYRDSESKKPLGTGDRFQIGSNTKQFTAAALLMLQEEGKIDLEDHVTKFLPQYPIWANVQIKDLLNHTAGIKNHSDDKDFMTRRRYSRVFSLDYITNYLSRFPLEFSPKTKHKYSNGGYIIAGKIIEVASGETWDQYIHRKFLVPMELNNTGHNVFFEKVSPVRGHLGNTIVRNLNLSWALSAGSLYSTVDDLANWLDIHSEKSLLNKRSRKLMHTSYLNNYGLGVYTQNFGSDFIVYHSGQTRGFYSRTYFLKKSKIKIISIENKNGAAKEIPEILLRYFTEQ
jgi:CubicO group peptidase (beta-lactamase class C family)